jgi:hypothetical protein
MIWNPGTWLLRWQTEDGINMEAPFQTEVAARGFRLSLGYAIRQRAILQTPCPPP